MLPPRPRRHVALVLAVVVGVLTSACSAGSSDTVDADRVDAIVEARQVVVDPAQAMGTAAAGATAALEDLVARPDDDTIDRVRAAGRELEGATDAVTSLELPGSTEDVRAAGEALREAAEAAEELRSAADEVVQAAEQAAELDDRLEAWVAAWDEAGSRSQLLARFDEVVAEAGEVSTSGASGDRAPTSCTGPVEVRREAAAFVADATAELREFVAAYDGDGFDARRAELDRAPFGTDEAGVVRGPGASIDPAGCPAVGEAEGAAEALVGALRDLQEALNPVDLAE